MTIKALKGGKLLCLMAAVSGAMALGSCKDDDKPEQPEAPEVPVDTTPAKVTYPNEFNIRINNDQPTLVKATDTTINAKTLLSLDSTNNTMKNSDIISFDVILRNGVKINSEEVDLTYMNPDLGKIDFTSVASINSDSIFSATVPAMPGMYSVSVNGFSKNITVEDKDLEKKSRFLSNFFTVKLDSVNTTISGITFDPYKKVGISTTPAHLSGSGKFVSITEKEFSDLINSKVSEVKANVSDMEIEKENYLELTDAKYFVYYTEDSNHDIDKIFVGEYAFAGGQAKEVSLKMSYSTK